MNRWVVRIFGLILLLFLLLMLANLQKQLLALQERRGGIQTGTTSTTSTTSP